MGGTYAFLSTASANLREEEDLYNHFWGGLAAGMIQGVASMLDLRYSLVAAAD